MQPTIDVPDMRRFIRLVVGPEYCKTSLTTLLWLIARFDVASLEYGKAYRG